MPGTAFAQKAKRRIGFLVSGARPTLKHDEAVYAAFVDEMRIIGYAEGRDFQIEWRYADNRAEQLERQALELAKLGCDVIVTRGPAANRAAKRATSSIPIVVSPAADPVLEGLVRSLARPEGNVTGLWTGAGDYVDKHFDLMKAVVPGLTRIAVLQNALSPSQAPQLHALQALADKSGISLLPLQVSSVADFERAFTGAAQARTQALIILGDTMFSQNTPKLAALALTHRFASVYALSYAETGGLVTYGPNLAAIMRRAAHFVDRILKGAKPAEMPFEQPGVFEFVLNLKTARALGITVPQSVLLRADRVIE